ncbi:MAG: YfhO family protein [Anaerolineae bacterium]
MSQRSRRPWLPEALVIAALVLLPLLFWWRMWAPDPADRAVIPQGDFASQYYPLQLFAARELAAGRLPAWDPYINAGQPGLADIQTGFYYPPNLLPNLILALTGLPFAQGLLTAQVILHFCLASLFTYLFVRRLARRRGARPGAARLAGAVAALSLTYGGYLTSFPVQQLTILETAVWLPLVLLFLDRAGDHPRPWLQLGLAGLALACAFLAGHPQTAMYLTYTALAFALFRAWPRPARGAAIEYRGAGSRFTFYVLRLASFALLPILLGLALAAIQLLPTLSFITRSTRAGLDYEAVSWGLPLVELSHLLYPGYFGGSPQYVGLVPLVLAGAAFFVKGLRRQVAFWLALAAVALLLAFGGHTFFYSLAYLLAPGFGAVRNQERILYLFGFAFSVLAGLGAVALVQPIPSLVRKGFRRYGRGVAWIWLAFLALTALFYFGYLQGQQQGVEVNLFEGLLRHQALLLLVLGGSAVCLALRLAGRRRAAAALVLGLIWLNLFTVNWQYNLAEPVAGGPFPETGLVRFLREQPGTFRISSAGLLPGGSSAGIVYRLEDITGNTPLRLEAFGRFEEGVGSWRRWQLLNVHYLLSRRDLDGPGLDRVYEEDEVKVYQVGDPLPRAWVVYQTAVADGADALARLDAEDFDPRVRAVLPAGGDDLALAGGAGPGEAARVVEAGPGRLVLEVSASDDGLLVVSQPFYPGWQAKVDGREVPIRRVDYLLQGVPLAAGMHRVALSYRLSPAPAVVSLGVLLAGLAVALWWRRA